MARKSNSGEYWKKRFQQIEEAQHQDGVQVYAEIEKQYRIAQRQIEGQIQAWYGRFATNNGVTIQEARRMLSAKELAELKWDVQQYIQYGEQNALSGTWVKELENASARFHISRLEALKLQTQQSLEVLFGNQLDSFDRGMRELYKSGYYRTAFEVQKGFGVGWDFATLDDKQIDKVIRKPWAVDGKNFSERIWGNKQKLINELNQTLTKNIVLGQDPQKAIDEIARKMNSSKTAAGRLVMTEEAFFSSAAQKDCFTELDVEQYEIVATLDSHTSDICQEMDGKHFPMSQWEVGVTAPPFHVWCRTTTVPYFGDEFDLLGERAARGEDGKTYHVPANMTYPEWKKSFVDGGSKADLQEITPGDTIKGTTSTINTIDDCKTTDDVVELFKSHDDWFYEQEISGKTYRSIDGMSLDGVSVECAKAVYRPFAAVFDKFPQLKGKLNAVNSAKLSGSTYANCMFGLGHGGISVNTSYYSDIDKLMKNIKSDEASGFHPKGLINADSIVMHELGHAIDDYLTYTEIAAGALTAWKPKIVSSDLRLKVMKACGLKISDIQKEVSGYATKDAQEWFAECFAEYMLADEPRAVAKEFGKQLEEYLKGVK